VGKGLTTIAAANFVIEVEKTNAHVFHCFFRKKGGVKKVVRSFQSGGGVKQGGRGKPPNVIAKARHGVKRRKVETVL